MFLLQRFCQNPWPSSKTYWKKFSRSTTHLLQSRSAVLKWGNTFWNRARDITQQTVERRADKRLRFFLSTCSDDERAKNKILIGV
ncbi:Protein of unknown function [Pyronema omphalodes CBS 100304]|uniref:Uncharacterized protein n=1 Tax=Pyronema omphalodes (strain CBS 100304) TaxID=1076935 RepID=U4KZZ1_PYROM|nr:Protein of unknown function [Pyronema omphalodes CBS 100304]